MKTPLAKLLIVVVLLFAAGCGGSDGPDQAVTSSAAEATAEQTPAEEATAEQASEPDAAAPLVTSDSPVEAMLGVPIFDDDAMNDWFTGLDVERRRVTAECMIRNGFEYSAEAPSQATQFVTELASTSREFAVTHGYGIVASFNAAEYDPNTDYGTTNSRYLASLTEPETDAYYVALYGASTDDALADTGQDSAFGVEGCLGEGLEEVFSVIAALDSLEPVAEGYYDQILADSRSIALYDTWSLCMAEAGFSFALPEDAQESFYGRLEAVVSNPAAFQEVEMSEDVQTSEVISFAGDTYGAHPKLNEQAQAELDKVRADEVATAVASWDCYEPLRDEETAIQREYEVKFVEEVGPQFAAAQADN